MLFGHTILGTRPRYPPQALRYEAADDSRLAGFLVARARRSLTVASFLFWCAGRRGRAGLLRLGGGTVVALRTSSAAGSQAARLPATAELGVQPPPLWTCRYLLTELGDDAFGPRAAVVQVRPGSACLDAWQQWEGWEWRFNGSTYQRTRPHMAIAFFCQPHPCKRSRPSSVPPAGSRPAPPRSASTSRQGTACCHWSLQHDAHPKLHNEAKRTSGWLSWQACLPPSLPCRCNSWRG